MNYHEFIRKIPKVELHCHLEGSVRASTVAAFANKNGVEIPAYDQPEDIYKFPHSRFFDTHSMISHTFRDRDDFRRATYEALVDAVQASVRYREMFWNPILHLEDGVSYIDQINGIVDGIQEAEKDTGILCRMIANLPRFASKAAGLDMIQAVIENNRDEVIGMGCEYEHGSPPQKWLEVYRLAKQAGLHRCGHAGQGESPADLAYCIDSLEFERVDHGYSVLLDKDLVNRCVEKDFHFTVCPAITQLGRFPWEFGMHPIREMIRQGLQVSFGSDDPAMIETDLALDYQLAVDYWSLSLSEIKDLVLNSIEGSWLDESSKRKWRQEWNQEIDDLIGQVEGPEGHQYHLDPETGEWGLAAAALPSTWRSKYA